MRQKGTVIEIRRHTVVVMTDSCEFMEIRRQQQGLIPGMEIAFELPEHFSRSNAKHGHVPSLQKAAAWLAVAAMLMLAVLGSARWPPAASAQPAFLASVDLNPSLTLTLDETGHVLKAEALNNDAARINLGKLRNKPLEAALEDLLREADKAGFLERDQEHYLVISLLSLDPSADDSIVTAMLDRTMITLEPEPTKEPLRVYILAMAASQQQAEEAATLDVPLNRVVVRDALQRRRPEGSGSDQEDGEENGPSPMVELVREMLEQKTHPVFVNHPGSDPGGEKERMPQETNRERIHPVFEVHPGDSPGAVKEREENRPHPVFDTHPGDIPDEVENDQEGRPIRKQDPASNHPVFEQHPGAGAGKGHDSAD